MDRETTVCPNCASLVPLADNVRGPGEHAEFVCPVCHDVASVGPLAKDLPGRANLEGLVERAGEGKSRSGRR
jgi:hypothetical protein